AIFSFPASGDNERTYMALPAENMRDWALAGWGGPSTTNMTALANPYINTSQAEIMMAPAINFVQSQNGTALIQRFRSYFDYYVTIMNGSLVASEATSVASFLTSRLIPETAFQNETTKGLMVDNIMNIKASGLVPWVLNTTPLLYGRAQPQQTALHPAWYKSVWISTAQGGWRPGASLHERKLFSGLFRQATQSWMTIATEGCSYANEADPWMEDWADQFWGENYAKLLEVKNEVDPDGLLGCWHCIGWDAS
ncbi:hypothetical protein JX265_013027, partial [Neoarthrinium moseri]